MSRHGYIDDYCDDNWAMICYQGALKSAMRGKKGQAFFRELIEALDSMPEKRLVPNVLRAGGEVCALGAVGIKRGMNLEVLNPEEYEEVSKAFGIAESLAREVEYRNDDCGPYDQTPEDRWKRMRAWAESKLKRSSVP